MTYAILETIFDTIWPDPNMQYIVNFHAQTDRDYRKGRRMIALTPRRRQSRRA